MSARSVEARLIKLEARRQRPNEVLLVWRRPDADVRLAVAEAEFAAGDKVICAEWFEDGALPPPRWYKDRLTAALDTVGQANLDRCLERIRERISDDEPRDPAFASFALAPTSRMAEMTDNQLLHALLGVAT